EVYGNVWRWVTIARAAHSTRHGNGSWHRRPEDEQELRKYDRYFWRRKRNAETSHEHCNRLKPGRSGEGSRQLDDLSPLLPLCEQGGDRKNARGIPARRYRLRRLQKATIRQALGLFRA